MLTATDVGDGGGERGGMNLDGVTDKYAWHLSLFLNEVGFTIN